MFTTSFAPIVMTAVIAVAVLGAAGDAAAEAKTVEHVEATRDGVTVRATVVPAGATLALTAQLLPADAADAAGQTAQLLKQLDALLAKVGASRETLARVNVYVATPEAAAEARRGLGESGVACAVTMVVSDLPAAGSLVAIDAVAVASADASPDPANVRLLKSDRAVYISGMAADGEMAEATRLTLEQLAAMLKQLGLTRDDVVHVKSFLRGATDVSASRNELARFFDGNPPPATWVEWTMKSPIEIELVAQAKPRDPGAKDAKAAGTVTYLNPPPSKVSPVYSRVALVHGGRMIFTSGIGPAGKDDPAPADAASETRRALAALRDVVIKAGGDYEHLVKATYYPASDATSAALNQVRPEFFNPARPPAASKAPARGTGALGRMTTLDFIAVTP